MNFKTGDKVIYSSSIYRDKIETVAHATKTLCYLVGGPQKYRQSTGERIGDFGRMISQKIRHPKPGEIEKLENDAHLMEKAAPIAEKLRDISMMFLGNVLSCNLSEIETIEKLVNELERLVKK